jgi:hypothetical protein
MGCGASSYDTFGPTDLMVAASNNNINGVEQILASI